VPIAALDPTYEDRHVFFAAAGHPDVRESLSFPIPLPGRELGVIVYTWVHEAGRDGMGRAGASVVAYGPSLPEPIFEVVDDILVPDDMSFDRWEVGPLKLAMPAEPEGRPHLRFDGTDFAVDCTFAALHPAFAYGPNPGGCPQWLAADRIEQGGRYAGTMRIGGRTFDIDVLGQRDHSWGMRDWGAASHWKWWNMLAPDVAAHAMEIQAFGQTSLRGYVHKDGVTASLLAMESDYDFDERFMHTRISAVLHDDAGRTTHVRTSQAADMEWPISPRLTLHEAAMHCEIDGQAGAAQMEMTWLPAYIAHHSTADVDAMHARREALTLDRA
jgi:hypothetical protein